MSKNISTWTGPYRKIESDGLTHGGHDVFDLNKPKWDIYLTGHSSFVISSHHAPNAFYRLMQRICLGIKYKRINNDER